MKKNWWKIILIGIGVVLMLIKLPSCVITTLAKRETREFIAIHPVEDLRDFFDMEGIRNEEFLEDDLGTWVVETTIRDDDYSKTMIIYLDRNTREGHGYFTLRTKNEEIDRFEETKRYAIHLHGNQLRLSEPTEDEELKEWIESFRFLVQVVSLDRQFLNSLTLEHAWVSTLKEYGLLFEIPEENEMFQDVLNTFEQKVGQEGRRRLQVTSNGGGFNLRNRQNATFRFSSNDVGSNIIGGYIEFVKTKN